MSWATLAAAILIEVAGALALRMATTASRWWAIPVAVAYPSALVLLSVALRHGMIIGVAYGVWTVCSVALTAIAGRALFQEPLTRLMAAGMVLVMAGVVLVEFGGHTT